MEKIISEFRLLNYIKCIPCIIFKVTFTHFSFQIIISNISLKLQAHRQRVAIGDQGCTHMSGIKGASALAPLTFWSALCFLPIYFHSLYLRKTLLRLR